MQRCRPSCASRPRRRVGGLRLAGLRQAVEAQLQVRADHDVVVADAHAVQLESNALHASAMLMSPLVFQLCCCRGHTGAPPCRIARASDAARASSRRPLQRVGLDHFAHSALQNWHEPLHR
jgi:hypothetical protein